MARPVRSTRALSGKRSLPVPTRDGEGGCTNCAATRHEGLGSSLGRRGGRGQVATAVIAGPASGLLPAEASVRTKLPEGKPYPRWWPPRSQSALLASRRLVAPLHGLTVAVTCYEAGDRSSRARVADRSDEIGALGQAGKSLHCTLAFDLCACSPRSNLTAQWGAPDRYWGH
jgi:HAMP domain